MEMEQKILEQVFDYLKIRESEILSWAMTWPQEMVNLSLAGGPDQIEKVRGKFQYIEVGLKNGIKFYLKRDYLSGVMKEIDDIGYKFMIK